MFKLYSLKVFGSIYDPYKLTPLLIKLHWLPIQSRIVFKILLLTFKILHGTAPTYLDSLISLKPQSCYNLRSSCETLLLKQPSFKSKVTLGDRSFTCAAPKLWNALPLEVRDSKSLDIFKSKLVQNLLCFVFSLTGKMCRYLLAITTSRRFKCVIRTWATSLDTLASGLSFIPWGIHFDSRRTSVE